MKDARMTWNLDEGERCFVLMMLQWRDATLFWCYNYHDAKIMTLLQYSSRRCYNAAPGDAMRTLLLPIWEIVLMIQLPHLLLWWCYYCPMRLLNDATTKTMPQLRWCYTHDAATILWWWCYDYEDKKNSSVRCHDGDPFAHEMTCWSSNYDDLTIWSCYNLLMMLKLWRCYNSSRKCYDTTPGDAMRTLLLPHERLCWWYNCPIYWSGDATTAPWDYLMMWQLKRCHNCVDATLMMLRLWGWGKFLREMPWWWSICPWDDMLMLQLRWCCNMILLQSFDDGTFMMMLRLWGWGKFLREMPWWCYSFPRRDYADAATLLYAGLRCYYIDAMLLLHAMLYGSVPMRIVPERSKW